MSQKQTELQVLKQIAKIRADKEKPHFYNGKTEQTLQDILDASPSINCWLRWYALNTRKNYAPTILKLCVDNDITPSQFLNLEPKQARDLAWKWIEENCLAIGQTSAAVIAQAAISSFYRHKDGEKLPWLPQRHRIVIEFKRVGVTERIPTLAETWQIIDAARSLRDKALIGLLFATGIRSNAATRLTLGDLKDLHNQDPLPIKITSKMDTKLKRRRRQSYWTFIGGELLSLLIEYVKRYHNPNAPDETSLFQTVNKKPVTINRVLDIVTESARLAGFKKGEIGTHTLRKAHRKILRQSGIPSDLAEILSGHVLSGTQESYYDPSDIETLRDAYLQANFSRVREQALLKQIGNIEAEAHGFSALALNQSRDLQQKFEAIEARALRQDEIISSLLSIADKQLTESARASIVADLKALRKQPLVSVEPI
jgi:integrase